MPLTLGRAISLYFKCIRYFWMLKQYFIALLEGRLQVRWALRLLILWKKWERLQFVVGNYKLFITKFSYERIYRIPVSWANLLRLCSAWNIQLFLPFCPWPIAPCIWRVPRTFFLKLLHSPSTVRFPMIVAIAHCCVILVQYGSA